MSTSWRGALHHGRADTASRCSSASAPCRSRRSLFGRLGGLGKQAKNRCLYTFPSTKTVNKERFSMQNESLISPANTQKRNEEPVEFVSAAGA